MTSRDCNDWFREGAEQEWGPKGGVSVEALYRNAVNDVVRSDDSLPFDTFMLEQVLKPGHLDVLNSKSDAKFVATQTQDLETLLGFVD